MIRKLFVVLVLCISIPLAAAENWSQFKYDARHSGDAADRTVSTPLYPQAAIALSDAVFTSPAVADGRIFVLDGAGRLTCVDDKTFEVLWTYQSQGGPANCSNVSSPAVVGKYVHFGTMKGDYCILNAADGSVVRIIHCTDPIFSAPVVGNGRVYFATLGSVVHCIKPDGTPCWTWDYVKEVLGFTGDRWNGYQWLEFRGRALWQHQFCCVRNIALKGKTLVVPAGGLVVWLEDAGDKAQLKAKFLGGPRESPATLGLSIGPAGEVYRQWTRRDNGGRVEILTLDGDQVKNDWVRGTDTNYDAPHLISFCSVSVRDKDVYRCRPEEGFGLCRHSADGKTESLGGYPSIAPPVLLKDSAVYGGLDGSLYVVPLTGGKAWSWPTPQNKAISAPAAVCNGRVYFGCEDGYLYILGPRRNELAPTRDLHLSDIRSPLTGPYAGSKYDRFTSFANYANTNRTNQTIEMPFRLNWIRRFKGTVKHFSTCGGGRMYTHTAEGQIFAVEQQTGRLLWRRYFPGVHVSYTSPLYADGRIYLPQAGLKHSYLRCLDAATGKLIWQAPFTGSPSWNRQQPPIIAGDLIMYLFGTGLYKPENWLFEHQSTFSFPKDHRPLVRAWNKNTGQEVWTDDFSRYGSGGDDAGFAMADGILYYSCWFGSKAPKGVTAAIDPATGAVKWVTTKYAVHAGCTVSVEDGRLYLGGYNAVDGKNNVVWCLDAADGSLVWKSDPVQGAIHVVTIGTKYLFTHAQYRQGYLIDKQTGKIVSEVTKSYRCTRFTLCEPYLLAANMNIHEFAPESRLLFAGPTIDVLQCVGGFVSNGRIFYTTNGGGLQASLVCGPTEAASSPFWSKPDR